MVLDFYKDGYQPNRFDIYMNTDGSIAVLNPRALDGMRLTVVLEQANPTPSTMQIMSMYAMISRYQMCEVSLYALDI